MPSLLISMWVIKLFICLNDEVIFLEMELFDISIKGKRGAQKDLSFGDLFSITKEAEPLR